MTGLLPHPDGDGNQCLHCDAEVSSLWRSDPACSGHVCRCNDCWRLEGWLPPKKKRGRKSKDTGADNDLHLVILPVSSISSITKIEAQRCLRPARPLCPCIAPARIGPQRPTPGLRVLRFCDPTHLPLLHEERRIAASQTDPYYLVLGTFKGTKPEDLGFPDKRWLSLDEMCATLEVATIEQKVEEYEAASKAARLAKLAASLPASPNALPATQDT